MDFQDKNNIFYKMIYGDEAYFKVYENDDFLVILDIFPFNLGHCLILPKIPAVDIFDLSLESAKKIYPLAQKIAKAVSYVTGCDGIRIMQNTKKEAGQVVFYFHLHVIPYFEGDMDENRTAKSFTKDDFASMSAKLSGLLMPTYVS